MLYFSFYEDIFVLWQSSLCDSETSLGRSCLSCPKRGLLLPSPPHVPTVPDVRLPPQLEPPSLGPWNLSSPWAGRREGLVFRKLG